MLIWAALFAGSALVSAIFGFTEIAEASAEKMSPQIIVASGLMVGISEHHMKHFGTITLSPGTFLAVLNDVIDSMYRAGFQNILVLNGHGGNIAPVNGVFEQFVRRYQVNLQFMSYWDVFTDEDAKLLKSGTRRPYDLPGHAQEFETSFALEVFPENVRTDMWTDQPDPTPAMATSELGAAMIERLIPRLVEKVRNMIDRKDVAEIPAFQP